ncbi:MAG: site-specific integrase [Pseudomonadota bacterium]|nr:site-specific integrase [Pseudomonadota bacterium]
MHNYQLKRRKGRNAWHIYWMENGEQRWASTGTSDEALASTFLATFKSLQQTSEYVNVGEILHQFTNRYYKNKAVSMERHYSLLRSLEPLHDCNPLDHEDFENAVFEWKQERLEKVKENTAGRELAVLVSALNWAADRERGRMIRGVPYIPKNRYHQTPRVRWLDKEETSALLKALPQQPLYLRLAVGIAISTAARKSAILELQKHQIKWGEGQIDFHAPADGKKRKARRVCDITGMVEPWLREAFDASKTGHIIERKGKAVKNIYPEFKALCEHVGLQDFRFHDLRSTWAAGAAIEGVPMEQIRDALGHSTVRITEQHYAQIHPDYRQKAREYAKKTFASDVTL